MFEVDEYFRKKKCHFSALESFGFTRQEDRYVYTSEITDGQFTLYVWIDPAGKVWAQVIDTQTGDEYTAPFIEGRDGVFVGQVREEVEEVLHMISTSCFTGTAFLFDQTNRLIKAIEKKYHEKPDCPFSKAKNYFVLRRADNQKWYGLVYAIDRSVITKKKKDQNQIIEVINIKTDPGQRDQILDYPGVYPGYHMNQKYWRSVILDETLPDETILEWIENSRFLVKGRKKKK